ncbi:hypothetical protein D3C72_2464260 [compost metagenome]
MYVMLILSGNIGYNLKRVPYILIGHIGAPLFNNPLANLFHISSCFTLLLQHVIKFGLSSVV